MIKLDHLVLRVSDYPNALEFYRRLFKFAGWEETPDPVSEQCCGFRQADGFTIWIGESKDLQTGKTIGWLDHYAFNCENRDKVDEAYQFCLSRNWNIINPPKAYPQYGDFYGFSFEGPDGLKLEFVTR